MNSLMHVVVALVIFVNSSMPRQGIVIENVMSLREVPHVSLLANAAGFDPFGWIGKAIKSVGNFFAGAVGGIGGILGGVDLPAINVNAGVKLDLKIDTGDNLQRLVDRTSQDLDRAMQVAGGETRATIITAKKQLSDYTKEVNAIAGQRIADLDARLQARMYQIQQFAEQIDKYALQIIHAIGQEVRATVDDASGQVQQATHVIGVEMQDWAHVVSQETQGTLVTAGKVAQGTLTTAGQVAQNTLAVAGQQARETIVTAAQQARITTETVSRETQTVLQKANDAAKDRIAQTEQSLIRVDHYAADDMLRVINGTLYVVERGADLALAVGGMALGLVFFFITGYGWGRAMLRYPLPTGRLPRTFIFGFMGITLVGALAPFVLVSKDVRGQALLPANKATAYAQVGSGVSQKAPMVFAFEPDPVVVPIAVASAHYLRVKGVDLDATTPKVMFGDLPLDVVGSNSTELTIDLAPVLNHPTVANRITVQFGEDVPSSVSVQVLAPTATPAPTNPPTPEAVSEPSLVIVAQTRVNIRNGPGMAYNVIGGAGPGTRCTISARNRDSSWWQVTCPESSGWIASTVVSVQNAINVVEAAYIPEPPPTATPLPTDTPVPAPTTCVEPMTAYFGVSAGKIFAGDEIVLNWGPVSNAESVAILENNTPIGVEPFGQLKRSPQQPTTYGLMAGYCGGRQKLLGQVSVDVVTPTPAATRAETVATVSPFTFCHDTIQGKIAWDYSGSTTWDEANINRLCAGNNDSVQPARCFDQVMHGGINWGGGVQWLWRNALNLCKGTTNADATISCFQSEIREGQSWQNAIAACKR